MRRLFAITPILLAAAAPALADDAAKGKATLPGVDGQYSIVTPAPEPQDQAKTDPMNFKAGNWDVTVSGYVWVQVGASSAKNRR